MSEVTPKERKAAKRRPTTRVTIARTQVVDTIDAVRFLRGERAPHYRWTVAGQT
jgi:hypothetical protein